MGNDPRPANESTLAQAQATIAHQAAEIKRLRRRLADERFVEDLREAAVRAVTAGTIAAPVTHRHLLELIVATAADVISARSASLFLVDEEDETLVFEVALGPKAEEVKKFRVPLGHGIAGLVATSGQPMAVADVQNDPRHAADIALSVGYLPQSILCVPLIFGDRVVGVLELLDKEGAPSFSLRDMETLGLFANQAAVAIMQSQTQREMASLIGNVILSLGEMPDEQKQDLNRRALAFAAGIEEAEDVDFREALELAMLVQEIARRGDNERNACRTILRGFADYLRLRPEPAGAMSAL